MSAWRDHSSVSSPNGALPEGNLSGLPPLIDLDVVFRV